jgi:hypothetical protein
LAIGTFTKNEKGIELQDPTLASVLTTKVDLNKTKIQMCVLGIIVRVTGKCVSLSVVISTIADGMQGCTLCSKGDNSSSLSGQLKVDFTTLTLTFGSL